LITGVSPKGIGCITAKTFAAHAPALLILASRTRSRLGEVVEAIRHDHPDTPIEIVLLDLGSQQDIRRVAQDIAKLTSKIDILVHNAGIVSQRRQATPEGIERLFGTNQIGPFLLTNLLLPLLRKAARESAPGDTRIVFVSSGGHVLSPVRFSDINFEPREVPPAEDYRRPLAPGFARAFDGGYLGVVQYASSKTANILTALYLQKHLAKDGIASFALHPGSTFLLGYLRRQCIIGTDMHACSNTKPSTRTSAGSKTTR